MNCFKKISRFAVFNVPQMLLLRNQLLTFPSLKRKASSGLNAYIYDKNPSELSETDKLITNDVLLKVNNQIKEKSHSRLFAVIKLGERRFKITTEDIIALNTHFAADVGDRIRLEKVLVVGSSDFTLLGRPILSKDLVRVEATVIEKTYIVPRPLYRHGKRHYIRLHWFRTPYVLFCINSIEFLNSLDNLLAVENIQNRVIY